jgi:hypothetical protein
VLARVWHEAVCDSAAFFSMSFRLLEGRQRHSRHGRVSTGSAQGKLPEWELQYSCLRYSCLRYSCLQDSCLRYSCLQDSCLRCGCLQDSCLQCSCLRYSCLQDSW